jgi:hypothetical protein
MKKLPLKYLGKKMAILEIYLLFMKRPEKGMDIYKNIQHELGTNKVLPKPYIFTYLKRLEQHGVVMIRDGFVTPDKQRICKDLASAITLPKDRLLLFGIDRNRGKEVIEAGKKYIESNLPAIIKTMAKLENGSSVYNASRYVHDFIRLSTMFSVPEKPRININKIFGYNYSSQPLTNFYRQKMRNESLAKPKRLNKYYTLAKMVSKFGRICPLIGIPCCNEGHTKKEIEQYEALLRELESLVEVDPERVQINENKYLANALKDAGGMGYVKKRTTEFNEVLVKIEAERTRIEKLKSFLQNR